MKYSKTIAGITIEICEKAIGEDLVLTLSGGEKPHIGCVVQAVPRPSLSGDGTISVTSSVINLTGHKDEFLCRRLAEKSMQGNRKSSGMHRRGAHGSYNGRTDRRIIKEYRSYDDRIRS